MFGINVGQVIKGHINEITKQERELSERRMTICRQCPLFTDYMGGICDSKKCYNSETKELSTYPKQGTICGCSCRLKAKTTLKNAKCVLNKW